MGTGIRRTRSSGVLGSEQLVAFHSWNGEFVHWYQQKRVKCVARKTKEQLIFNLMSQNKVLVETSELTATEIRKVLMFQFSCLPACKSFILDSEPDPRGWIKHEHMLSFSCGSAWISDCEKSTDNKLQGTQCFLRLDSFSSPCSVSKMRIACTGVVGLRPNLPAKGVGFSFCLSSWD